MCRDVLCCLLFLVAVAAAGYVLVVSLMNNGISEMLSVRDKYGNTCKDTYPYLFINVSEEKYCVKSCPTTDGGSYDRISSTGTNETGSDGL